MGLGTKWGDHMCAKGTYKKKKSGRLMSKMHDDSLVVEIERVSRGEHRFEWRQRKDEGKGEYLD